MEMSTTINYSVPTFEINEVKPIRVVTGFFLAAIGISANLTVIIVFINCKIHRRSFTYLLVLQQSSIDLITNGLYLALECVYLVAVEQFSDIYCKAATLLLFFSSASALNLVFISIDRYIALVYPLKYWIRGNHKKGLLKYLCLPFFIAFIVTSHYVFILHRDPENPRSCIILYSNVVFQILSGCVVLFSNTIIPISVMAFCYYRVYVTLMKQMRARTQPSIKPSIAANDPKNVRDVEMNIASAANRRYDAERNFVITMIINTLVYIICVSPSIVVYLVYTICECFDISIHISFEVTLLLFVFNTAINPFVYAYKFSEYREGFGKTFCRQC